MIPIARPFIGQEEKDAVLAVMDSRMLAAGPKVKEFEEKFAKYVGVEHAVAVSSGTSALHLALLAMGVGKGDEVITTPLTFFASASTIMMTGAKPVFADVERDTLNLDPEKVKKAITKRTKAIVPVHLYGLPASLDGLKDAVAGTSIKILEDACQAHGAMYKGKKVGAIGDAGCFSFYPTKNMMAGEGGMVTTNSRELAESLRLLRNHGSPERYTHTQLGYNLRMMDMTAAIGIVQMGRLEGFNEARRKNAAYLTQELSGIKGLTPPSVPEDRTHVFHQYAVIVEKRFPKDRSQMFDFMRANGVGADVGYHIPLNKQPVFEKYKFGGRRCKVAEDLAARQLLLPVHPGLSQDELATVAQTVKKASMK